MLGAIFAFTRQHGLDDELFRFVLAHGCVELSVMVLSVTRRVKAPGVALVPSAQMPAGHWLVLPSPKNVRLLLFQATDLSMPTSTP